MASNQWMYAFVAMCAVTMVLAQEDTPLDRPWHKAPVADGSDDDSQEGDLDIAEKNLLSIEWVACDYNGFPSISCQDCNTKLICLSIGGLPRTCRSPRRPYCNNGFCSATPSANCTKSEE